MGDGQSANCRIEKRRSAASLWLALVVSAVLSISPAPARAQEPLSRDAYPANHKGCLPDLPGLPPPLPFTGATDFAGNPYRPDLATTLQVPRDVEFAVEYTPELYQRAKTRVDSFVAGLKRDFSGCAIERRPDGSHTARCDAASPLGGKIDKALEPARSTNPEVLVEGARLALVLTINQVVDLETRFALGFAQRLEGFAQRDYMLTFFGKDPARTIADHEQRLRKWVDDAIDFAASNISGSQPQPYSHNQLFWLMVLYRCGRKWDEAAKPDALP